MNQVARYTRWRQKYSSETSVKLQWAKWRYTPNDRTLQNDCCEKFKSYKVTYNLSGTEAKLNFFRVLLEKKNLRQFCSMEEFHGN
jgi:hypothetical protein